jgi:hypothetical protein
MVKYTVNRAYTELGIHHEVGTVIVDESLILNIPVKLWDGTLSKEEVTNTPKVEQPTINKTPKADADNSVTK